MLVDEAALRHLLSLGLSTNEKLRVEFLLGESSNLPYGEAPSRFSDRYASEGVYSVMDVAGGRGADFARNQDQGVWAEQLLRAHAGSIRFVYFGLSDPVLPSDTDYDATRRKHRYMLLVEGKRPDLLVFDQATLMLHSEILDWSERPLTNADRGVLRDHALAGAEIKSSLQHYAARQIHRKAKGGSDISVTVKEEEFTDLNRWEAENDTAIVVIQVFVDAIFIVSFRKFQVSDTHFWTEEKTTKKTFFLPIDQYALRAADIAVTQVGYTFNLDGEGGVERPPSWPAATIANVNFPDFQRLKAIYRRKSDST